MSALTEDEARKQICPFIRVPLDPEQPVWSYEHQYCQASACKMAWRWCSITEEYALGVDRRGYCGACGKP